VKPRKSQDEEDLEKLAKRLLTMPHKPREETKIERKPERKPDARAGKRQF